MTEEMIKQIKRLLFDYTEVYDDEPIIQGLQLLIKDNYISKDKIIDNIKELEEKEKNCHFTGLITECEIKIEILNELLEEK